MHMKHVVAALALTTLAAGSSLLAHHSYSAYDMNRIVEVEGVLEEFSLISPHSLVKVTDRDGRRYIFEWRAAHALQREGVNQDTFTKGDRLIIAGNPHRDFDANRILNSTSVRRPADGWTWPNR
jgi:hypothetical protein